MERKLISIEGTVFNENGDITEEEFLDAFCKFLEDKGWHFAGLTREEVDGVWDEYKSYNISEELENTWNLEFIKTKELLKKEGE